MSLTEMYRTARSLETLENYANAVFPLTAETRNSNVRSSTEYIYQGEEEFWKKILQRRVPWDTSFELYDVAISEWIGRIPGLYWTKNAGKIRRLASNAVEFQSRSYQVLNPLGKSQKVMGGVGTLKFPPDIRGYRLVSLTASLNASAGIPILISPEVWMHHRLREGSRINRVKAKWQSMSGTVWSERFPSTREIPKGFLVLENPDDLSKSNSGRDVATQFHPCTVMEYVSGNAILYDFVYATADSGDPKYRSEIEQFFDRYKNNKNRHGRYLLSADIDNPLWEAEFETPEALRRAEPGAKSQLELLQERIFERSFSGKKLDDVLQLLTQKYENDDLKRLSSDIAIPTAVWFKGGSVANSAVDFLAICVTYKKMDALIDKIALEAIESFM